MKIWRPYTQAALDPPPIPISRGEGAYLYTSDGRKILDAVSSWWVTIHGHAHPLIAEAIAKQAATLEHVIFAGFTHEPAEQLAQALRRVMPKPLSHLFFSDDGSTAVEVALKMAVQYWRNVGQPQRTKIVALEHAYHGDTAGAMSVSDDSPFTTAFDMMRFPVKRGHSAYCFRCPVGKTRDTCDIECLDRLRAVFEEHHREIAAIIVEPMIQGAAGMIIHPIEFLQRMRKMAADYGVLFIADEVFTGFGRTGKMFACDLAGIAPDMMCMSKGLTGGFLPMGATACTEEIYRAFDVPDRALTFFHGHSYTGNPLGCAAALASLRVFETEPVFERIAAIESIHRDRLLDLAKHSQVETVRWLGDVGVLELNADDPGYLSGLRNRLYNHFLERGILLRPLGNIIYILPPYVIDPPDLHRVYDAIAEFVD
jgi:adenosylmethionine-8-amino-7-oxononanoate aminotransferase